MLIFVTSPIYLYKEWPLFLFLYFRKCIKTVVLLDRPSFVPSAGDIVFLLLFSKVMKLNDTLFKYEEIL